MHSYQIVIIAVKEEHFLQYEKEIIKLYLFKLISKKKIK